MPSGCDLLLFFPGIYTCLRYHIADRFHISPAPVLLYVSDTGFHRIYLFSTVRPPHHHSYCMRSLPNCHAFCNKGSADCQNTTDPPFQGSSFPEVPVCERSGHLKHPGGAYVFVRLPFAFSPKQCCFAFYRYTPTIVHSARHRGSYKVFSGVSGPPGFAVHSFLLSSSTHPRSVSDRPVFPTADHNYPALHRTILPGQENKFRSPWL